MGRLYIVRHGESESNKNKNIYSLKKDKDIKLTEKGIEESINAGKVIKNHLEKFENFNIDIVFVSPYLRALDTLKYILKSLNFKGEINHEEALKHKDFGLFFTNYKDYDYLKKEYPEELEIYQKSLKEDGLFKTRFPKGESPENVYNRMIPIIKDIEKRLKENKDSNILVVTHGCVIKTMMLYLKYMNISDYETIKNEENCKVLEFVYENDKWI